MPLGRHYGLKGRPKKPSLGPSKDPILEKAFQKHGHKVSSEIVSGDIFRILFDQSGDLEARSSKSLPERV